ncbi:MAG: bifunctional (p)ppGpp synthetase/guanosine-3',5'-bis(diphosphate) 3'-pyrophosphohydrolase [Ruminococcus sp.]|nr:bifunctional (p)ppGpp synthetase/guanosine-3',5'-bis(diphosphate) 3'-pyrophosphohydrolase [Ruminococcus sp.]
MIYTELTNKAMKIAYEAHHGQHDINGIPYVFHPYHVAEQMKDELSVCVALLHDVVEDTDITMDMLEKEFPAEVINALRLMTHEKGTDYYEYIKKIRSNPIAKAVKLADIAHNSDFSRIVSETPETDAKKEHWKEKYSKALSILNEE